MSIFTCRAVLQALRALELITVCVGASCQSVISSLDTSHYYRRRERQCERNNVLLDTAFGNLTFDSSQGLYPGHPPLEPVLCREFATGLSE